MDFNKGVLHIFEWSILIAILGHDIDETCPFLAQVAETRHHMDSMYNLAYR